MVDQPVQSGDSALEGHRRQRGGQRDAGDPERVQVAPGAEHTLRVWLRSDPPDDPAWPRGAADEVSLEFFNSAGAPVGAPSTQRDRGADG